MKLVVSANDFSPLLKDYPVVAEKLSRIGVDAIELQIGYKSRFNIGRTIDCFAKKGITVYSLHQPVWSYTGVWFDEKSFSYTKLSESKHITIHPPSVHFFSDQKYKSYYENLAKLQSKNDIQISLENMPSSYNNSILKKIAPLKENTNDLDWLYRTAKKYNLGITFDIDHIRDFRPHLLPQYNKIFPHIKNIHLSSFRNDEHHLSLGVGDFKAIEFLEDLKKRKYAGILTLEVKTPSSITLLDYDPKPIKESVDIVRSVIG